MSPSFPPRRPKLLEAQRRAGSGSAPSGDNDLHRGGFRGAADRLVDALGGWSGVRLRLVIVAVFASAAAVPGLLLYGSGLLSASTGPDDQAKIASAEFRVTSLSWPKTGPLALAATDRLVVWEQRNRSYPLRGIWAYDIRTQQSQQIVDGKSAGTTAGDPAAAGDTVVWAAWPQRRGRGRLTVQGYDENSLRRWRVSSRGHAPVVSGDLVVWIAPHEGLTRHDDALKGVNTVTDERFEIPVNGRARSVAVWGSWVAWVSGSGDKAGVWAGSTRQDTTYQLAARGTSVAADQDRIVWAAKVGQHSSAIISWNRRSSHSAVLWRFRGEASSIALGGRAVAWVETGGDGKGHVWAYDFNRGRAYEVSPQGGAQASPVILGGSVFWADDRSGQWELYGRALQP